MTERNIYHQTESQPALSITVKELEIDPEIPWLVRAKLTARGIRQPVFDLDDTLIDTRRVFFCACEDVIRIFKPSVDDQNPPDISVMLQVIRAFRPEFQVNPAIMEAATLTMAKICGVDTNYPLVDQGLERVRKIYCQDIPPVLPGAREVIRTMFLAGFDPILVTHGQERYTNHKLRVTGFAGMFSRVISLSPDCPKADQWLECFEKLGIKPNETLVVGDNLEADILGPAELDSQAVWVINGSPFSPSKDSQEELLRFGKKILKVDYTSNLIKAILSW